MFEEVDPCRTARGEDRQTYTAVAIQISGQSVEQLCSLFHNREVGCKIGIEHVVEAQCAKRIYHLAGNNCTCRIAKRFAQCNTHCRSSLYYNNLIGICQV